MVKLKQAIATLLKGILAGGCIGIGGYLYLIAGTYNKVIGGLLFAIGLTLILNFGYFLYTGKICYLLNHLKRSENLAYPLQLIVGLIGNMIGALVVGLLLSLIKLPDEAILNINQVLETKMANQWYVVLLSSIGCNIMIYFAVEGFNKIASEIGKYIVLFGCIAGFVIMCFEHCVANMFYIGLARSFSWEAFAFLGIVIIGNTIGGLLIPAIIKLIKVLEKRA